MNFQGCEFLKLTTLLLSIACTVNAFEVGCWKWGRCPNIDVQQNFNISKYEGRWYEQAIYNTWSLEGSVRCVSANYTWNQTEGVLNVENRGICNYTDKWVGINGTASVDDPSKKEGKLTAKFHLGWWTFSGKYWVLGTDYENYSVVYSCDNRLFFFHELKIWFLSRDQQFYTTQEEQSYIDATSNVLITHNLDPSVMERTSQANCEESMD